MTDFDLMVQSRASQRLDDLIAVAEATREVIGEIGRAAAIMRAAITSGHRLYFCGNGGSAADAQHVATEYVVRYMKQRRALPAIALTTDTSLLTAAGNDFGFDEVFARQVDALVGAGDVLVIHSTSGRSPNVLKAAERARGLGAQVIGLTAQGGGPLRPLCDVCISVPTSRTDRAQELHLFIEHLICELIEEDA
jgi:D-sedoheptulose 7-phosphate isomerase